MRDIKFRAWDKDLKQMHICGQDVHDSMTFDENNIAQYYNLQNGCGSPTTYELMQYTGLKDKNGKEIYEGDIVKVHFKKGCWKYNNKNYSGYKNGNIEFCVDCFIVYIKNYKEKIYPLSSFGKGQLKDIEKIGNIYDNLELLGGK